MASYYYLISSFPTLRADGTLPFGYDEFLRQCEGNVSSKVYKQLKELNLASNEGPLVKEWSEYYSSLMDELNNQRRSKLGKPVNPVFSKDSSVQNTVNNAMNASNPLEAEHILLAAQFSHLDQLVSLHFFDDNVLFGYAIKLKLLERSSKFSSSEGSEEFSRLFTLIQNKIMEL